MAAMRSPYASTGSDTPSPVEVQGKISALCKVAAAQVVTGGEPTRLSLNPRALSRR